MYKKDLALKNLQCVEYWSAHNQQVSGLPICQEYVGELTPLM